MTASVSLSAISRDDLETLRAINATYSGGTIFSDEDENPIAPVVHTQHLQDEWVSRREVCTFEDLQCLAWSGERLSLTWFHEGVSLSLTTFNTHVDPTGQVHFVTHDLTVSAHGVEYRLPATGRLNFTLSDLRIPRELLDYLEEVVVT